MIDITFHIKIMSISIDTIITIVITKNIIIDIIIIDIIAEIIVEDIDNKKGAKKISTFFIILLNFC